MSRFWSCGPVVDVSLAGRNVAPVEHLQGIIDTGASVICVDKRMALKLGLSARDRRFMQMADGSHTRATVYPARVVIPELGVDDWMDVYGVLMAQESSRLLLGRSFLRRYFVTYEGPTETFKFSEAIERASSIGLDEHDE